MNNFVIEGGIPLHGTIKISGSKNASLPLLFASILVDGDVNYTNIPALRDINTTVQLLNILGRNSTFSDNSVSVKNGEMNIEAPYELVKTMRASALCLGPLLARKHSARVSLPGGCAIGARPVDQHLKALEKLGAVFSLEHGYIIGECPGGLRGAKIRFDFPTVGGTENTLMAASLAKGTTVLENAAREPEIVDLANFLNCCGAKISGQGSSVITVEGVENLHSCTYSVMPDRIESGTYLIAAGVTGGRLLLKNCPWDDMSALIEKLQSCGMIITQTEEGVLADAGKGCFEAVDISTQPHPGFPTDMQAQFMVLLCCARGTGIIKENIFENRFMHVQELIRMGADIHINGSSAVVRGVKQLNGAPVMSSDLRAGAALVLAGLAAQGTTTVQRIYHIERGYEFMEEKLRNVGAKIQKFHVDE